MAAYILTLKRMVMQTADILIDLPDGQNDVKAFYDAQVAEGVEKEPVWATFDTTPMTHDVRPVGPAQEPEV